MPWHLDFYSWYFLQVTLTLGFFFKYFVNELFTLKQRSPKANLNVTNSLQENNMFYIWRHAFKRAFSPEGKQASIWTKRSYFPALLQPSSIRSFCIQLTIISSHRVNIPSHHRHQLVTQVIHSDRAIPNQPLKSLPFTRIPIWSGEKHHTHTTVYIFLTPPLIWSLECRVKL